MVKFGGEIGTLYQFSLPAKTRFKKHPLQNRTNVQIKGANVQKNCTFLSGWHPLFSSFFGENSWCLCLLIFKDLTLIALNSQDRFAPGDVYKMNHTFFVMRKGIRVRF